MSGATKVSKRLGVVLWVLQVVIAVILGQTLFFKFSGSAESVYIFTTLGVEPWGRWAAGCAELAAVVLVLTPRTAGWGALLALLVMSGAIGSHLTRLGIEIRPTGRTGDHGLLFGMALVVFVCSGAVAFIRRREFLPGAAERRGTPTISA
ncbi:MAG: DoxX family protein [Phycisphaerales bacterium]|nr:DoxX family protein [Phycisphaerales bacterium]